MADNKFRYLNEKCPVCNSQFRPDDDIVVCPYCGTPHHRECFKENTKCANEEKHGKGFRWEPDFITPEETAQAPLAESAAENMPDAKFTPFGMPVPPMYQNPFASFPQETEEGIKTEETALFVRHEAPKYIQQFFKIKEKRKTWNWAAFFFTPYWFFYRKMYKLGAIFLALTLLLTAGINMLSPVQTLYNDVTEWTEKYNAEDIDELTDAELQQAFIERNEMIIGNPSGSVLVVVQAALSLAMQIFVGFKANKWYYDHTVREIKKIHSEEPQTDIRFALIRRGGTSYSAAFLAILAEKAVIMLLELILSGTFL